MEAYLVQHGEAEPEEKDPERPLSARGRKEVAKVAALLSKSGVRPAEILHSPKLRAKQTAEILSSALGVPASEFQDIRPNDDPSIAKDLISARGADLMLVGHLPNLSRLASLLITGNPGPETVKFRMGGAVCLVREEKWKVKWMLVPEMAE
ncbi:MAG: phosphohistidine phosphatase SixA [Candidatus Micrarchaeota archaeon]